MRFIFSKQPVGWDEAGMLVRGVLEHPGDLEAAMRAHDKRLDGHLKDHVNEEGFEGKFGEKTMLHTHGKMLPKRLALLGLGPKAGFGLERLRAAAAASYRLAATSKVKRLALGLPWNLADDASEDALAALLEGLLLAEYDFRRYKTPSDKPETRVEEVVIHVHEALRAVTVKAALERAAAFAGATNGARDLVNTPALDMHPAEFVQQALALTLGQKRLGLKIYGRPELERMGCGGILAIAQGSVHEPKMVHLTYKPAKKARKRIVLVGKGVTFDSGGLSLKPADAMTDMRIDMAGAAAVMAVFKALPLLNLPVEVHGIAALVENMPSGTAIRPGDIVKTMSGKTIEILNTDAEGRVTLADALWYGGQLKPDMMVDLATLTGACMVALGQDMAGLMTDDEKLAARLEQAGRASGEPVWRLPLFPGYAEMVKSRHADYKNITGSRYGGAITAGLFLKEFTDGVPWAHLDIAGPAYNEKDYGDERSWGASGYGARLLLEFLRKL